MCDCLAIHHLLDAKKNHHPALMGQQQLQELSPLCCTMIGDRAPHLVPSTCPLCPCHFSTMSLVCTHWHSGCILEMHVYTTIPKEALGQCITMLGPVPASVGFLYLGLIKKEAKDKETQAKPVLCVRLKLVQKPTVDTLVKLGGQPSRGYAHTNNSLSPPLPPSLPACLPACLPLPPCNGKQMREHDSALAGKESGYPPSVSGLLVCTTM